MAQARSLEVRVGIFVLVGLVIIAGLIVKFGKLDSVAGRTYEITVVFPNVGGIVRDASVLYAGIPVGKVKAIQLHEDDRLQVRLVLQLQEGAVIRRDAKFIINQAGLLGDKYIDVVPGSVTAEPIRPGDVVAGTMSVDLTEAIRHVVEVLKAAAGTIERVDNAIKRIDETVLSRKTLDHVSGALANVDTVSTNAVVLLEELRQVVAENRTHISGALTRFEEAAGNLTTSTKRLDDLVVANQDEVALVVSNLVASTERLETILARAESGTGTIGKLLTDPTLYDEVVRLVQNWRKFGLLYKEGRSAGPPPPGTEKRGGRVPVPARPAQ